MPGMRAPALPAPMTVDDAPAPAAGVSCARHQSLPRQRWSLCEKRLRGALQHRPGTRRASAAPPACPRCRRRRASLLEQRRERREARMEPERRARFDAARSARSSPCASAAPVPPLRRPRVVPVVVVRHDHVVAVVAAVEEHADERAVIGRLRARRGDQRSRQRSGTARRRRECRRRRRRKRRRGVSMPGQRLTWYWNDVTARNTRGARPLAAAGGRQRRHRVVDLVAQAERHAAAEQARVEKRHEFGRHVRDRAIRRAGPPSCRRRPPAPSPATSRRRRSSRARSSRGAARCSCCGCRTAARRASCPECGSRPG